MPELYANMLTGAVTDFGAILQVQNRLKTHTPIGWPCRSSENAFGSTSTKCSRVKSLSNAESSKGTESDGQETAHSEDFLNHRWITGMKTSGSTEG